MPSTESSRRPIPRRRGGAPRPLFTADISACLSREVTHVHAQARLIQALDELQRVRIDAPASPDLAERFHRAFVHILQIAQTRHLSVEGMVVDHMSHALRVHFSAHDRIAHALVSSWTRVPVHDPVALVVRIVETLDGAAPLPVWLAHLLQLLPPAHWTPEAGDAHRRVECLLQPWRHHLNPAQVAASLHSLEVDPGLHGLRRFIGGLSLLALARSPSENLARFNERPPGGDDTQVWFSREHPALVCVGHTPCDDPWWLTPLAKDPLDRLLALCARAGAATACQLRHQVLYALVHATRPALTRPARRHPGLALVQLHRVAQAITEAGDPDPWSDILHWLAPHRSAHPAQAARQAVFELLLSGSRERHEPRRLR